MTIQPDSGPEYPYGLEDMSITEPIEPESEEEDIYEEIVRSVSLVKLVDAYEKAGQIENLKALVSQALIRAQRIARIEADMIKQDTDQGYSAPTLKYRKQFEEIQHRARVCMANFQPTEWEVIYASDGSVQNGPTKRNWIVKNKDRYLPAGVWSISSRTIKDPMPGVAFYSECIVRYLGDAPKDDPDSVLVVTQPRGRQRK